MLSNSLCRAALRSGLSRLFLRPHISYSKILQTRRSFSESVPAQPTNHAYDDVEVDDVPDFGAYSIILPPEPFVFGTDHIVTRNVPAHIPRPLYVDGRSDGLTSPPPVVNTRPDGRVKTEDPEGLRKAASVAREVLAFAGTLVQPGVTTDYIDGQVHEYIIRRDAYPSPLLYKGFPKSCCTSVNNVIAHGIPDERPLEDGDTVNIDITVYVEGYHGDTSRTFLVGDVDEQGHHLVQTANAALEAGIAACGPGRPFKGIGAAIHELLRRQPFEYHVSPSFTGHGIGTVFHRPPWIIHEKNDEPGIMKPGECFTIEPCVVQGLPGAGAWTFPDGWTTSTENTARSAQAEHMVLVTENGVEVLTR